MLTDPIPFLSTYLTIAVLIIGRRQQGSLLGRPLDERHRSDGAGRQDLLKRRSHSTRKLFCSGTHQLKYQIRLIVNNLSNFSSHFSTLIEFEALLQLATVIVF
jgi:hypothetical protein